MEEEEAEEALYNTCKSYILCNTNYLFWNLRGLDRAPREDERAKREGAAVQYNCGGARGLHDSTTE
jgi:hypothetical protein